MGLCQIGFDLKTYQDWLIERTNMKLLPVMAVGGEERAFVDEVVSQIKRQALSEGLVDFNYDVVSAKESSLESVFILARALPILSQHRLVMITDSDVFKTDGAELLEAYLASPNQACVLLFVLDQIDLRNKFQKCLSERAIFYKLDHPKEREMLALIQNRAGDYGLKISFDAAWSLYLELGNEVLMLDRAFEKLSLSCEGGVITAEKIEEQVSQTAFQDAFVLARAVAMQDRVQIAKSLCELKKAQEVPLKLLGLLAWQLRLILKVRLMLDERKSGSEIGSRLNLFGERLEFAMRAAHLLDTEAHIKRFLTLQKLDMDLKTSRVPAWILFDQACLSDHV